jgi:P pilus assembly chaperone PapD
MIRAVRRTLAAAALAELFVVCAFAHAQQPQGQAKFNVTPTRIVLRHTQTSTSLLLKNESADTIRFQVSAFSWANDAAGEMKLEPTRDIVFFPALFSIASGQTRRVRVATSERATTHERAYRFDRRAAAIARRFARRGRRRDADAPQRAALSRTWHARPRCGTLV